MCKVIGRSFSQNFLKKELSKVRQWKGRMELISIGRGFYSIKCSSNEVRSVILAQGPWFILGSLLWCQPWRPGFKASNAQVKQFPVWLHFPEMPIELFEQDVLRWEKR